jgi:N-acetylglucosamine-6-phosphate deacetylase
VRLGVRACLVGDRLVPGDLVVDGGEITDVGAAPAGSRGTAVPGFVDVQVNGFAGTDFATAGVEGYRTAAAAMAAFGVTSYQPTYICLPEHSYPEALAVAAEARRSVGAPRLLGVHLEGPFLSPARTGAHDPANTRLPDPDWAADVLGLGPVSYTTVAPELPGALEVIRRFVAAGVVVALGHSDAESGAAHAGFDAGARAVTHLFNAQRPWRHRDPGIAGAALVRDEVALTVILDGHHLAPETVEMIRRCAPGRMVLITDSISAAGRGDGEYPLDDRTVTVRDEVARLADGTLAGSVLTMDRAVRNLIGLGASFEEAVAAATATPASLIGRPELGSLEPGTPADVAVLDDDLSVERTLVGGTEIHAA